MQKHIYKYINDQQNKCSKYHVLHLQESIKMHSQPNSSTAKIHIQYLNKECNVSKQGTTVLQCTTQHAYHQKVTQSTWDVALKTQSTRNAATARVVDAAQTID